MPKSSIRKSKKRRIRVSRPTTVVQDNERPRITKQELINFYALEQVMRTLNKQDEDFPLGLFLLDEIASKLVNIALHACQTELRYGVSGGEWCIFYKDARSNRSILNKLGVRGNIRLRKTRSKIDFNTAEKLFNNLDWSCSYGGDAWATIAHRGRELQNMLPVNRNNWSDVFAATDILVDTFHNNARFLQSYTGVNLYDFLDNKGDPDYLMERASGDVAVLQKRVMRNCIV